MNYERRIEKRNLFDFKNLDRKGKLQTCEVVCAYCLGRLYCGVADMLRKQLQECATMRKGSGHRNNDL